MACFLGFVRLLFDELFTIPAKKCWSVVPRVSTFQVTKAARELARKSHKDDLLYSLDLISDLFIQLGSVVPFMTLQWCYMLKLMQHSSQSLWVKVMQVGVVDVLCRLSCRR